MEHCENLALALLLQNALLVVARLQQRRVERRLERGQVVEDLREQEVEQRPQLGQVVLQRSAGQ